jgi:2-oxoglutarate ferredoxin oxidoreductase subunit alpha
MPSTPVPNVAKTRDSTTLSSVVIRFAGDSGDGMQLAGAQFTDTSALLGNDISTLPDFPAEIRAPAGTLAGVSGFQIHFASDEIYTPGDEVDALVAMNPAALKMNLSAVQENGLVIVNGDAFTPVDLRKAGYASNPLEDGSISGRRLVVVPISSMTARALDGSGLTVRQVERCKNMFALGLACWLYGRPIEPTLLHIEQKFGKKAPALADANARVLRAGFDFGETTELLPQSYQVPPARLAPGTYRKITGNQAIALGFIAAARLSGKQLIYCSYPITPASDVLHELAARKDCNVITFQAEDEIASVGAAIGASFGGALGVTGTSGPGLALKQEAIGLAVMTELPLVVLDVQRAGPSTGMPTKTEQSDLFQAVSGRNGECPVVVMAPASPSDCFDLAIEAATVAMKHMTPVIVLSDGYLANSSEPWKIPHVDSLPKIVVDHPDRLPEGQAAFHPYQRDENFVRPWALPGTPGLEHRIGGLEKQHITGNVSYDPENHEKMVRLRAEKVARIKPAGPGLLMTGPRQGRLLVVGWGGTFGALKSATLSLRNEGMDVSHCHVRYLHPLPGELESILRAFDRVLVAELNLGQLRQMLRARFLVDARGLNKVRGQPFTVREVVSAAKSLYSEAVEGRGEVRR